MRGFNWIRRRQELPADSLLDDAIYPQVSSFWSTYGPDSAGTVAWSPRMWDRVWVANRCLQLCSQELASMPLRFFGNYEPAWVANPDPVWFPNGIGDAVFAAAWSMYGWGDAFLYVTDRYASGLPSAWTVLNPATVNVQLVDGRRVYRNQETPLDPDNVVQISRDPRGGLRGTSALAAYAGPVWGMLNAGELNRNVLSAGGMVPPVVLWSKRKLNAEQAQAIQAQWVAARVRAGGGVPGVLSKDQFDDLEQLSFSPADLLLLDVQEFDARVIASAFSVPSFMLNLPLEGGLTYQNPETLFEVWWRNELRPAAGRIQRALSANMLPRGNWVEFDARAVLAPTFQNQVSAWLDLKKEGVVTTDEVRAAILHLPPIEQGEALDELTEPPTAAASPADEGPSAVVQELRPGVMAT